MKKSDLISGKHIVESRDGSRMLVAGDFLPDIDGKGYMGLKSYKNDLKHVDGGCGGEFDICKVYEIVRHMGFPQLATKIDIACKLVWERKPELSEAERVILTNISKEYKYIARDRSQKIYLYKEKPVWSHGGDLFKMIDSEAWEPTLISDLLGE